MAETQATSPVLPGNRSLKLVAFLYGAVAYLTFLVTILYAIGFVSDIAVPKAIDTGEKSPFFEALAINLALMSLFAVQHSVMARKGFKQWWTQFIPKPIERSTYVLFASLTLLLLFWQWRPMPATIWHIEGHQTGVVDRGIVVRWLGDRVHEHFPDQSFRTVRITSSRPQPIREKNAGTNFSDAASL